MEKLITVYKLERKYSVQMRKIGNTEMYHFIGAKEEADINFVLPWNQIPALIRRQKRMKRKLYNAYKAIGEADLAQWKKMSEQPSSLPSSRPVKRLLESYYKCSETWLR
tara:strand:+ start:462 stop:788 length:327 start_codon:yes stop_codon:yes gene_type:complete